MRVAIEHVEEKRGVFKKVTHYKVDVKVTFSEEEMAIIKNMVIAHPTPAIGSAGSLTASTKRMVSNTEARLAFAVLTTERKAA